jgi:dihydropteroate synthase
MELLSQRRKLDLRGRVAVVAIINVTPDSYVSGSRHMDPAAVVERARVCLAEGADILEIGGESTGPGSIDISLEEERRRVLPAVEAVRRAFPECWIAVDTYKSSVAAAALENGADMINDVTAGRGEADMFSIVAEAQCPLVLMFAKDPSPRTTVASVEYPDVVATVHAFLAERIAAARAAEISASQIIIDPGLGHFLSSDPRPSFEVIARLREFEDLGPILLSPSRKSFLASEKKLPPEERLPATLAITGIAVQNGAKFIRTHDVLPTRRAVDAASATVVLTR